MQNLQAQVYCGDALQVMQDFPENHFDAIITDPPYASGGKTLTEKQISTAKKYTSTKVHCPMPDFEGDNLDQRSWTRWMTQIFSLGRKTAKPGAVICAFCDWRQLPALTDAIQWAGWTWRGVVVWDKGNSRPQKGRFRQQSEYVVWGSNGPLPRDRPVPVLPGVFREAPPTQANRYHQTEKPLELMRHLVKICVPKGRILDPFCGSGTTLQAAIMEGYECVGVECSAHYAGIARQRAVDAIESIA